MKSCAHIIVQGRVQGVGFRYFTSRHAVQLGLVGFARNLYTGEVEIEVEGERGMIDEMIEILKVGPRSGHVTNLIINRKDPKNIYDSFQITG